MTLPEIADAGLPDLPRSVKGLRSLARRERWQRVEWEYPHYQDGRWRRRRGAGGGIEFHASVLPARAQHALMRASENKKSVVEKPSATDESRFILSGDTTALWQRFECLTDDRQEVARRRLAMLDELETLVAAGETRSAAIALVSRRHDVARATLWGWLAAVRGLAPADRLPALADRRGARRGPETNADACAPDAWAAFKADYLRLERPSMATCYRRLQRIADGEGWTIPSARTLERRLQREMTAATIVLAREGIRALQRMYPAQRRDRSDLAAMQLLNADGRKHDIWVEWPDGTIGRPVSVTFQDVYSGKILGWRHDKSEHKDLVRLAFGDVADRYGLPDGLVLDNGRGFAAKWLTGRSPTRFRFAIRDEDPVGLFPALGVHVHWATPYHGQSKPIERRHRDWADEIDRHPAFAGAWCGNRPDAKPENYRSRAVPYDVFRAVFADEVRAADARAGRRSAVCAGRSIDDAFNASYRSSVIRWASAQQRRLWLLAAEGVTARAPSGEIHLLGNRYWSEMLTEHLGEKLTVRFDPAHLHRPLAAYRLDGTYLGDVGCIEDTGFVDHASAREQARKVRDWVRKSREALAAERELSIDQVAAMLPALPPDEAPAAPSMVRPVFGLIADDESRRARANGTTGLAEDNSDELMDSFRRGVDRLRRSN